jgi:hypothetical protein
MQDSQRKTGSFKGAGEVIFVRKPVEQAVIPVQAISAHDFTPDELEQMEPAPAVDVKSYVLDKIRNAEVLQYPFPHMIINEVFPPEFYKKIAGGRENEAYKLITEARGSPYPDRSVADVPAEWGLDWMLDGDLTQLTNAKFLAAGQGCEILLMRDKVGYSIGPHTDTPRKAVTALFYTPKDDRNWKYGTAIYKHKKGLSDPKGLHGAPRSDFECVKTATFTPNTLLIFARSDVSWHGVEPFTGVGERDILLWDSKA